MDVEPILSQTRHARCAVEGRLVNGGEPCTVVLIREHTDWLIYPHGVTGLAVRITGPDAVKLAGRILAEDR